MRGYLFPHVLKQERKNKEEEKKITQHDLGKPCKFQKTREEEHYWKGFLKVKPLVIMPASL